jgi:hypothetical protein
LLSYFSISLKILIIKKKKVSIVSLRGNVKVIFISSLDLISL